MKPIFFILSLLLSLQFLPLHAEMISRETASQIAQDFFTTHRPENEKATKAANTPLCLWDSQVLCKESKNMLSTYTVTDEAATFYVFGRAQGKGFVIVAGDDQVRPILGYSFDETAVSVHDIPENMRTYLLSLSQQIAQIRYATTSTRPTTLSTQSFAQASVGHEVVNLHTAEWAQRSPFNLQCPTDNGSHCATGCIPTAFSIIMRHHQWPDSGDGTLPAYLSGNKGYPIDECDLSQRHYRWDLMLQRYDEGHYNDSQADAVAQLMADVGHCFEVGYGLGSTGGYHNTNTFRKFLSHFKYDASGERVDRDILNNDNEWVRRIKADLDASRPIAYAATSAINANKPDGRHIFVCDGYTDRDYFHFNWGWGGNGNGYFVLSAMNPDDNFNFILHHIAYFNIKPVKPTATYTVQVFATEGGSARVDGRPATTVHEGETVKLTARALYDYRFSHWSVDGQTVSELANYEPVITQNTDFTAHFVLKDTGIESATASALRLSAVVPGQLHIENASGTILIYQTDGRLVHSLCLNGTADIQLPSGIYLVKSDAKSYKISIR